MEASGDRHREREISTLRQFVTINKRQAKVLPRSALSTAPLPNVSVAMLRIPGESARQSAAEWRVWCERNELLSQHEQF
jgi:hypothetical protein